MLSSVVDTSNLPSTYGKIFLCLLRSSMCTQYASEPTHRVGHTLDLVIARDDKPVSNVHVGDQIALFGIETTKIKF